ncbi:MAG: NifB/NifX family molybdenum-iron cluster-binding protein [Euryarchaeota archaeon]|nr:NifB/NifX family molybdenum-iron cluster-binding protein [Euryarchaeota archaeon]
MKVCIPSMEHGGLDDAVGQHFGMVTTYTVLDTETKDISVVENTSEHRGGVGMPPELLSKAGVDIMLCGGLGGKAVKMFEDYGIEVFIGAQGTVQDAITAWEAGKLSMATNENACNEHRQHGHHH